MVLQQKHRRAKAGVVLLLAVVSQLLFSSHLFATHLRAGQITARRVNCAGFTVEITIRVYTDSGSPVLFGGEQDVLDFGDGTSMLVPETANTALPEFGPDVATASFTITHNYPGNGTFIISYLEPNRNEGVLNMDNSVNTTFYLETKIIIDPFFGCNNTPQLLIAPIDRSCAGQAFFHNPGAFDPDGDSLSYELVVPFREKGTPVTGYRPPDHSTFYSNCPPGNEEADGPPTFSIDAVDGTLLWDAPCAIGEYNIAFIVIEWKEINGQWYNAGFVRRDMQIIVDDCDNERPDLIVPEDICVEAGSTINETIIGIDPDNDQVKIEAYSEILEPSFASPATVNPPAPGVFANQPAQLQFTWTTACTHVKDQTYQVVFKVTDMGAPRLVTFKTWKIKVVGPAPNITGATPDFANRKANLVWDPYPCLNASAIQVWRRVDSVVFTPDSCQTGMPDNLGYELLTTVGVGVSAYTDSNGGRGLGVGAKYCYRLVAVFPLPGKGESYVSNEICIPPIEADAPVITHVTVDKTGIGDGEVRISWRSPFQINTTQFPGPYEYQIQRANGFGGTSGLVNVLPGNGKTSDTTVVDAGMNSEENVFNYRNILHSNTVLTPGTWLPIDTSLTASMVRLDLKPQSKRMELNWSAVVPWSNQVQARPRHLIYRGPEDATENDMVLIDSIDVFDTGFVYVDSGQWNGTPLDDNTVYCYRVMTRGGYGNPAIDDPRGLENFSQISCAQPKDTIPPCQPALKTFASVTKCEDFVNQYGCNPNSFVNEVRWTPPTDPACIEDVRAYNVYATGTTDGEYFLLATNIRDTVYYDSSLSSYARCYKISAIDRAGNESELSEPACNDNCPYYELPNVFSPNGDFCNDVFAAYGYSPDFDDDIPENYPCRNLSVGPNGENLTGRCARFVQRVHLKVYNRWGDEVYTYTGSLGDEENNIYVEWDGRNKNGTPLSTGIYFYAADVTFDVVDPKKRVQTIKGWVHLVR